ncbi:MAG TPA: VOC family protein [Sphingomicrobium sp.]|nr:VOC family protein [Sphingomicrobium sp.]
MTNPIPEGYNSVTPYLVVDDAAKAIEFYKKAFGAEEKFRMPMGENRIGHAEIKIGDSFVMLADEFPEMGHLGPRARGGTTVSLLLYVNDVDSAFKTALDAGAKELRPLDNQFWGDRMGTLTDPFGHQWSLATHVEDISEAEMESRMKQFSAKQREAELA